MDPWAIVSLLLAGVVVALGSRVLATRSELTAARAAVGLDRADATRLTDRIRGLLATVADQRAAWAGIDAELASLGDGLDAGLLRVGPDGIVLTANKVAHELLGRAPGLLVRRPLIEAVIDPRIERLVLTPATELPVRADLEVPGGGLTVFVAPAPDGGRWLVLRDADELLRLRRIRTEFLDNLSHELRTPVTTIGILAESLALEADAGRSRLSPKVRERIAKIELETGHLSQMIGELLDLARIESGRGIELNEEVDLLAAARSVVERLHPFAERSEVRLDVSGTAVPPVRGDRARLEQVLVNLLHNAIKFSTPGSRVEVKVATSGDEVSVAVRDEGIGIDPDDLARLFERFYKADRARVPGRGTGLGLAIARHVIEAHAGRIEVDSTLGLGSTFTVRVPVAREG